MIKEHIHDLFTEGLGDIFYMKYYRFIKKNVTKTATNANDNAICGKWKFGRIVRMRVLERKKFMERGLL